MGQQGKPARVLDRMVAPVVVGQGLVSLAVLETRAAIRHQKVMMVVKERRTPIQAGQVVVVQVA